MSRAVLLLINGAILTVCAVVFYESRSLVLTALLLFLPLFDRYWTLPRLSVSPSRALTWLALVTSGLLLILLHPQYTLTAISIVLFTALPEEWFFRSYMLVQMEHIIAKKSVNLGEYKRLWLANLVTSILFSLLHLPVQGWYGLMVLFPSLVFGWLYQKYRDLVLVTLLHTLSNLVFIIYFKDLSWLKITF